MRSALRHVLPTQVHSRPAGSSLHDVLDVGVGGSECLRKAGGAGEPPVGLDRTVLGEDFLRLDAGMLEDAADGFLEEPAISAPYAGDVDVDRWLEVEAVGGARFVVENLLGDSERLVVQAVPLAQGNEPELAGQATLIGVMSVYSYNSSHWGHVCIFIQLTTSSRLLFNDLSFDRRSAVRRMHWATA